jgi:hypothetical protein
MGIGAYRVLVGKPERPLGKKDNIEMDLQKLGWGGMDRIDLAQDRDRWRDLVNAIMNLPPTPGSSILFPMLRSYRRISLIPRLL